MNSKFPEPRGWAQRWDGSALFPAQYEQSQDVPVPPSGWESQWTQEAMHELAVPRNGNGSNGHMRPRSWALYWDGDALAASANGHGPVPVPASEPGEVGAA
ncbi:MAG: hypothetical protein PVI67_16230 [Anaerolineae bacterium]|jgi:hypothetical protein